MPNIASILKEEITRLARKEVKAGTSTVRKASGQQRRDIAELKRQVNTIARQLTYLERQERKRSKAPAAASANGTAGKRFSVKGLKTHRKKLGLSAADYGALVGVTAQTIYNWESESSKPGAQQRANALSIRDLGKRDALQRLELLD